MKQESMSKMSSYCSSRFTTQRRFSREVFVGNIGVGGNNPLRIQSMTTTVTTDVAATVKQTRALVDAGCEIVRITAPNVKAAEALKEIRKQLDLDKIDVPLVADIHFLPSAAMEAIEHVEKVRVNPGNYIDKKKFQIREYSDSQYTEELERLHESFSPLVLRSKELGKSLRIGTNHGSLSDRIMNRFGDSPLGMVESALEFIRIAESHNFHDIILSMKASNPKVMIQAYRMVVAKMNEENMNYPLHLGVTEAGDGEDGRIKSTIGIGSLLMDGLGDTIRVSLTEDPVYEIPVAKALAEKVESLWINDNQDNTKQTSLQDPIDPLNFSHRATNSIELNSHWKVSTTEPPKVFLKCAHPEDLQKPLTEAKNYAQTAKGKEIPTEGWMVEIHNEQDLTEWSDWLKQNTDCPFPLVFEIKGHGLLPPCKEILGDLNSDLIFCLDSRRFTRQEILNWNQWITSKSWILALGFEAEAIHTQKDLLISLKNSRIIAYAVKGNSVNHTLGSYRLLNAQLKTLNLNWPIWIRIRKEDHIEEQTGFLNDLLESSLLSGPLLCDGIGNIISIETLQNPLKALSLAYNVLQGAGARISKTEYVACPSCGRTLFDLQTTTQMIRNHTGHLKGVKIAVMGCIVNGPGEMADADFGYVGGVPGKVNLYINKECVKYHVDEAEAVDRLIDLIKENGKWTDPIE